jgi:hypothetical protein
MKEAEEREKPGRETPEQRSRVPKEKLSAEDMKKEFIVRTAKILLVTSRDWFARR